MYSHPFFFFVTLLVWRDPFFLDPNTEGIEFEGAGERQRILMFEELPRRIKLAIINYDGKRTIKKCRKNKYCNEI